MNKSKLQYYRDSASKEDVEGSIPLKLVTNIRPYSGKHVPSEYNDCAFEIETPSKVFFMIAPSPEQREEWLDNLELALRMYTYDVKFFVPMAGTSLNKSASKEEAAKALAEEEEPFDATNITEDDNSSGSGESSPGPEQPTELAKKRQSKTLIRKISEEVTTERRPTVFFTEEPVVQSVARVLSPYSMLETARTSSEQEREQILKLLEEEIFGEDDFSLDSLLLPTSDPRSSILFPAEEDKRTEDELAQELLLWEEEEKSDMDSSHSHSDDGDKNTHAPTSSSDDPKAQLRQELQALLAKAAASGGEPPHPRLKNRASTHLQLLTLRKNGRLRSRSRANTTPHASPDSERLKGPAAALSDVEKRSLISFINHNLKVQNPMSDDAPWKAVEVRSGHTFIIFIFVKCFSSFLFQKDNPLHRHCGQLPRHELLDTSEESFDQ